MGHCVGGLLPAALRLRSRQGNHRAPAQVGMQRAALNKYAAPDNLARLADALQRSAAEREVHGRLTLAAGPGIAADEMIGRRGAGDLQQPDKCVEARRPCSARPSERRAAWSMDRGPARSSSGW